MNPPNPHTPPNTTTTSTSASHTSSYPPKHRHEEEQEHGNEDVDVDVDAAPIDIAAAEAERSQRQKKNAAGGGGGGGGHESNHSTTTIPSQHLHSQYQHQDQSHQSQQLPQDGLDVKNVLQWRVPNEISTPSSTQQQQVRDRERDRDVSSLSRKSATSKNKKKSSSFKTSYTSPYKLSKEHEMFLTSASSKYDKNNSNDAGSECASELTNSTSAAAGVNNQLWNLAWNYINSSVNACYNLCEENDDEAKCLEAIESFEQYKADFEKLLARIEAQKKFESSSSQHGGISWEIRKSSFGTKSSQSVLEVTNQQGEVGSPPACKPDTLPLSVITSEYAHPNNSSLSPSPAIQPHLSASSNSKLSASAPAFTPSSTKIKDISKDKSEKKSNLEEKITPTSKKSTSSTQQKTPQSHIKTTFTFSFGDGMYTDFNSMGSEEEEAFARAEAWVRAQKAAEDKAWREFQNMNLNDDDGFSFSAMSTPRLDVDCEGAFVMDEFRSPGEDGSFLSSENSTSPKIKGFDSYARNLHMKLSSPERIKKLNPDEERIRLEQKLSNAELNRNKNVEEIKLKAQLTSLKVKAAAEKNSQRAAEVEQKNLEKLKEAEIRHSQHIKAIRGKAGNENIKVQEVAFINSLLAQDAEDQILKQLEETDKRIEAGRMRRQERLENISTAQRKKFSRKMQQMSENKFLIERQKMERYERLQKEMESVHQRRERRLLEIQKRRQELAANSSELPPGTPSALAPTVVEVVSDSDVLNAETEALIAADAQANQLSQKKKKERKKEAMRVMNEDELIQSFIDQDKHYNNNKKEAHKLTNVQEDEEAIYLKRAKNTSDSRELIQLIKEALALPSSTADGISHFLSQFLEVQTPQNASRKHSKGTSAGSVGTIEGILTSVDWKSVFHQLHLNPNHTFSASSVHELEEARKVIFFCRIWIDFGYLRSSTFRDSALQTITSLPKGSALDTWLEILIASIHQYLPLLSPIQLKSIGFIWSLVDLTAGILSELSSWAGAVFPTLIVKPKNKFKDAKLPEGKRKQKQTPNSTPSSSNIKSIEWKKEFLMLPLLLKALVYVFGNVESGEGKDVKVLGYIKETGIIKHLSLFLRESSGVVVASRDDSTFRQLLLLACQFLLTYSKTLQKIVFPSWNTAILQSSDELNLVNHLNRLSNDEQVVVRCIIDHMREEDMASNLISVLGSHVIKTAKRGSNSGSLGDSKHFLSPLECGLAHQMLDTLISYQQIDLLGFQQLSSDVQSIVLYILENVTMDLLQQYENHNQNPQAHSSHPSLAGSNNKKTLIRNTVEYVNVALKLSTECELDEVVKKCLVLLNYFCLENVSFQKKLSSTSSTLLLHLADYPIRYLTHPRLKEIYLPVLISACYDHSPSLTILRQELNPTILLRYLQKHGGEDDTNQQALSFQTFSLLFPRELWEKAIEFFSKSE